MWLYHRVMSPNDADGMANSVDPDQTAPLEAVWSGSALFAQAYLSEKLGSLRYEMQWLLIELKMQLHVFIYFLCMLTLSKAIHVEQNDTYPTVIPWIRGCVRQVRLVESCFLDTKSSESRYIILWKVIVRWSIHCVMYLPSLGLVSKKQLSTNQNLSV